MQNHKFLIESDRQMRRMWQLESMALEMLDTVERNLDSLDKMRELTAKGEQDRAKREARYRAALSDPATKRQAQNSLSRLAQERRTANTQLESAERMCQKNWSVVRNRLQVYLAEKKRYNQSVMAGTEIMLENEAAENAGAGGGMGWMGQLGMAVFAWKASNAFDDLAKLSGRKS